MIFFFLSSEFKVGLLESPWLRQFPYNRLFKDWDPKREGPGVHHMKAFVFDNVCILTG